MKLYVIRTETRGMADGDWSVDLHVEFNERKARQCFRVEVERLQHEGDHDDKLWPTVELSRVKLLDLPKRELVKALLECGHHAGDCTVLEAWEYVGPKNLRIYCPDCEHDVYLQVYVTRGRVGFCVDCDWEPEGGRHE